MGASSIFVLSNAMAGRRAEANYGPETSPAERQLAFPKCDQNENDGNDGQP
jgi:hypothetical protein